MLVTIRTLVLLEDRVICDYERKCGLNADLKSRVLRTLKIKNMVWTMPREGLLKVHEQRGRKT